MPAPNLPAISDPLDPAIQTQSWLARDAFNTVDGVQGVALPEAQHAIEPTAEGTNGTRACIKAFCDYVQGLTPITALQIATFFRPPVYTTAGLPAASTGEGRVVYDTTLNRLASSNGTTWNTYLAVGDAPPATINVVAEGGGVDTDDTDTLEFDEQDFVVTDNADGSVTIEVGQLGVSQLPAGVDRTLFTYATVAGPVDTVSATDILSQSISGNTLSADGQALEVDLAGELHNQSGSNQTWEIAVLLGGVEIYRDTTGAFASSTAVKPWRLTFRMTRVSSTTLHFAGFWNVQVNAVQPDTGLGDLSVSSTTTNPLGSAVTSPTVAWGSSQTLQVRITCSSATNTDFQRRSGFVKRCAA